MKNTILIAAITAITFTACSKSGVSNNSSGTEAITVIPASAVPAPATAAFARDFSGATEAEWHKSSSGTFTVQFNQSAERHDASFDDSGHQTSHSVICFDGAVPAAVLNAFRQQFPTDNVYEWKLANDGTWKAHFNRNGVKYEATFSASGTLLKFEQSK